MFCFQNIFTLKLFCNFEIKMESHSKYCLFCYKPVVVLEKEFEQENLRNVSNFEEESDRREIRLFFELVKRYLKGFQLNFECGISAGIDLCQSCIAIVKSFNKLYHECMLMQLKLNWKITMLKDVMELAGKVPSELSALPKSKNRLNESGKLKLIIKFREMLFTACKLSQNFSDD